MPNGRREDALAGNDSRGIGGGRISMSVLHALERHARRVAGATWGGAMDKRRGVGRLLVNANTGGVTGGRGNGGAVATRTVRQADLLVVEVGACAGGRVDVVRDALLDRKTMGPGRDGVKGTGVVSERGRVVAVGDFVAVKSRHLLRILGDRLDLLDRQRRDKSRATSMVLARGLEAVGEAVLLHLGFLRGDTEVLAGLMSSILAVGARGSVARVAAAANLSLAASSTSNGYPLPLGRGVVLGDDGVAYLRIDGVCHLPALGVRGRIGSRPAAIAAAFQRRIVVRSHHGGQRVAKLGSVAACFLNPRGVTEGEGG